MTDAPNDVKPGEATPAGNQPAPTNPSNEPAPTKPEGNGGDKPDGGVTPSGEGDEGEFRKVKAERLNELIEKANRVDELESKMNTDRESMQNKLDAIAAAASGKSKEEVDNMRVQLSKKWGVEQGFVDDLFDAALKEAKQGFAEELRPLRQQTAQVVFDREMNALSREFPEVNDMSSDERNDFKQLLAKPEYRNVPLRDLWVIHSHGRPSGTERGAEPSRGGSAPKGGGDVDIASMSLEQFEEYSNDLAKKG